MTIDPQLEKIIIEELTSRNSLIGETRIKREPSIDPCIWYDYAKQGLVIGGVMQEIYYCHKCREGKESKCNGYTTRKMQDAKILKNMNEKKLW